MTYNDTLSLIVGSIASFGVSALEILTAVIAVAVGFLVFWFGWKKLATDQSLEIGGYYVRQLPFKGYHRFRSKKWNMEHMP